MRVTQVVLQSDHILLVMIQAEPADLVIIQVYMPTSTHKANEMEEMYEQLDYLMKAEKGNTNRIVMGDWNCIIGEGQGMKEVGAFWLGTRNERGERLIEFFQKRKLVVTNTCFEHTKGADVHGSSQETLKGINWITSIGLHQLDYILVRQKFRNCVKMHVDFEAQMWSLTTT